MSHCNQGRVLRLVTTVGSIEEARRLAAGLVEGRLAACAQLEPGLESHYRWEGRPCQEPEVRLTAKTSAVRLDAAVAWLLEHHPYQLPQLTWQEECASADYAGWVERETASAG